MPVVPLAVVIPCLLNKLVSTHAASQSLNCNAVFAAQGNTVMLYCAKYAWFDLLELWLERLKVGPAAAHPQLRLLRCGDSHASRCT